MYRDVEFLQSRLGKMDGFGDTAEHLLKIIRGKSITATPEPAPNQAPAKTPSPPPPRSPAPLDEGEKKNSTESQSELLAAQAAVGGEKNGKANDESST